jgi:hypothetical protein
VANRGFEVQTVTDLSGATWTPLNVPANAPHFLATNRNATISDNAAPDDSRYYRVRVFEP